MILLEESQQNAYILRIRIKAIVYIGPVRDMDIQCDICDRQVNTRNEDVYVTVSWVCNDLVKKNNVQSNKNFPQVVKICKQCWENTLKDKPQGTDYYWLFNRTI